jgi:hypothetical protein
MAHIGIGYFKDRNYMHQNRCILLSVLMFIVYYYKESFYRPLWLNKMNYAAFCQRQSGCNGNIVIRNSMYYNVFSICVIFLG